MSPPQLVDTPVTNITLKALTKKGAIHMINNQIKELDDQTAASILSIIAQSRIRSGDCVTQSDSGIQSALKNAFELPASPDTPTQGELARDALLLLATIRHTTSSFLP
ncbi:MAG: hypothetical protein GY749_19400 [Desulfobacteraceae bacterium]|nr:hypothetical protein [Desulfobacteraceae bacterium]